MDQIGLLTEMRQGLLDFIEDLMIILPDEKDLVLFHIFIENQIPLLDVMNYIVKNILPLKSYVDRRDAEYFKTHAVLFEHLGNFKSEVNRFKTLWDANEDEEDREMVWKWLERFIFLGEKYKELPAK